MDIRKLVKAGQNSHTICLPKDWLDKNKLKKGDNVYLVEKSDTELVITPQLETKKAQVKEVSITVDGKDMGSLRRETTSAFINNYDVMHFIGEEVKAKEEDIKAMTKDFVALEVVDKTEKRITAKDLLNLGEISIDKTLRRMDMIVRTILKGEEGEYELNKFYFMLYRILKGALTEPRISEALQLKKEHILNYWYINMNLERLGGEIKQLMVKKANKKIMAELETNYLDCMKAYFTQDKKLADEVLSRWKDIHEMSTDYKPEIAQLTYAAATYINNIARMVIDDVDNIPVK